MNQRKKKRKINTIIRRLDDPLQEERQQPLNNCTIRIFRAGVTCKALAIIFNSFRRSFFSPLPPLRSRAHLPTLPSLHSSISLSSSHNSISISSLPSGSISPLLLSFLFPAANSLSISLDIVYFVYHTCNSCFALHISPVSDFDSAISLPLDFMISPVCSHFQSRCESFLPSSLFVPHNLFTSPLHSSFYLSISDLAISLTLRSRSKAFNRVFFSPFYLDFSPSSLYLSATFISSIFLFSALLWENSQYLLFLP